MKALKERKENEIVLLLVEMNSFCRINKKKIDLAMEFSQFSF